MNASVDSHTMPMKSDRLGRMLELILMVLFILAAFAIRVYELGSLPDTVLADEADNAQDSVRILHGITPENGFFGLDWTDQPAFSAYKEATFLAIFGFDIFAMRLSSAVISTLALIPFYLLLRRQFSMIASLLAAILLATNVWYLNFSRSGWNCVDIGFYMLTAMLFVVYGLDAIPAESHSHRLIWLYFAAAGFFCALGLYGYPAGRAITLAVIGFVPVSLLLYRQHAKMLLLGYVVLFAAEAVVFAPEAIYIAKNWEHFTGRTDVVSIFNNPEYQADPQGTMLRQLERNLRAPWDGSVNNTAQYSPVGEPQLDRAAGWLALLGIALTILLARLRRRPETWLWWLMMLAGWALTQLFTVATPNGARGIGYMPTLLYFSGAGLDGILAGLRRVATRFPVVQMIRQIGIVAISVFILFAGYTNVKHYVDWQTTSRTRQDRYLYITAREFPDWAASIVDLAKNKQNSTNVGQWRDAHPIQDIANPYGETP